jgi:hypothetical protein
MVETPGRFVVGLWARRWIARAPRRPCPIPRRSHQRRSGGLAGPGRAGCPQPPPVLHRFGPLVHIRGGANRFRRFRAGRARKAHPAGVTTNGTIGHPGTRRFRRCSARQALRMASEATIRAGGDPLLRHDARRARNRRIRRHAAGSIGPAAAIADANDRQPRWIAARARSSWESSRNERARPDRRFDLNPPDPQCCEAHSSSNGFPARSPPCRTGPEAAFALPGPGTAPTPRRSARAPRRSRAGARR